MGLVALALLLAAAGVRAYVNAEQARTVRDATEHHALRSVLVESPRPPEGSRTVSLPATLRGQHQAAIHARTNGYVRAWMKDIGDQVRKGDVLAIIDTPEVDQDLAQALAATQQVQARLDLATSSLARWEDLYRSEAVSLQELDERRAARQQAQADLAAAQANVRRLQQLHEFGRITAPFDGVVVQRHVEVGSLVAAGSASSTRELFYLAQADQLRLTVAVPQVYAADLAVGSKVSVKLIEQPLAPVEGRITRISGGVDVATRSVQVEVALLSKSPVFRPGSYVQVGLPLAGSQDVLLVSPNTLQFREQGPQVAVVSPEGQVTLRSVTLGRDLGKEVEITSGIAATDVIVLNPPDTIVEGERVLARRAEAASDKAQGNGKGKGGKGKASGGGQPV